MISSEVQRTLVKSPPELWTELSDPDALARHLGELGEIRITRVKPEELVEWEADGTSGTVAIKASGWGTKVTLTVTRALPVTEAPLADPGPQAAELRVEEPRVEEPRVEEPAAPAEIVADVAGAAPAPSGAESDSTPAAEEPLDAGTIPFEPTEPTPAPATEAARRAAGWPPAHAEGGTQVGDHLGAAEGLPGEPSDTRVEYGGEPLPSGPTEEIGATAEDDAASDEGQAQPRGGFFARLFGRRRRKSSLPTPPAESADLVAETDAPIPAAEPTVPDAAGLEDEAAVSDPAREAEAAVGVVEAPALEAEAVLVPETPEQGDDHQARAHATEPGSGELELGSETAGQQTEPVPALDTSRSASVAATPETPDAAPQRTGNDLAAELKGVEETAAEEVTALLTGVLDRLGAAHHRPFSRS